jgi:putative peptidoglycan lipid II flippase
MFGEGITGLALGILVGGVLQLLIQIPVLYQKGFRLKLFQRFKHPAAKTIGLLMVPRLFSSAIYQLNNFVDSIFGSLATIVGEGGVAALYFAYRLILFPIGIFSNALSQAILPTFSTQAVKNEYEQLKHTLSFGLRSIFFVMLPASVGFMVLATPIIQVLFEHGKFDFYSTQMTSDALFFYSIGLFAYGSTKILQSCFFALKDTVTPTKVSFLALIINIILNSILMFPLKLGGLALATSISGIIAFSILFLLLRKKIHGFNIEVLALSFIRILLASICMGAVCAFISHNIVLGYGFLAKLLNLCLAIISGLISYVIFCFILRVEEIQELWRWLVKRKL